MSYYHKLYNDGCSFYKLNALIFTFKIGVVEKKLNGKPHAIFSFKNNIKYQIKTP